jgi:hypothetical protein
VPQDIGDSEAEAIERGDSTQWQAVARRMDELGVRVDTATARVESLLEGLAI